jgi:5'(3')-deoxyribonucleotidase
LNDQFVVCLDIDGVCVNPTEDPFLPRVNQLEGTHYTLADITTFDYRDCLPLKHAQMIMEMWADPKLYDDMQPDPKAVAAIARMRRFSRVVALSTPTIGHSDSKLRFLIRPPLSFPKKDIIILFDKSLVIGDVLIDDNIENLLSFNGEMICFAQQWNLTWDPDLGLRTNNWRRIVPKIREMATAGHSRATP